MRSEAGCLFILIELSIALDSLVASRFSPSTLVFRPISHSRRVATFHRCVPGYRADALLPCGIAWFCYRRPRAPGARWPYAGDAHLIADVNKDRTIEPLTRPVVGD